MDKAAIEALKAAHPILQVLADLGVETVNNRFRCPRPENHTHGDRTPSVSVWPERGSFKCWVCPDVRGDAIDLVRLVKGCSFREAMEFLGAPPEALQARGRPRPATAPPRPAPPPPAASVPAGAEPPPLRDASGEPSLFGAPPPTPGSAPRAAVPPPDSRGGPDVEALRHAVLVALLNLAAPVGGAVGRYLTKRRIFKRTWDGQRLRMIEDYAGMGAALTRKFGKEDLVRSGFFNAAGNLRYYRHRLLFPYLDAEGRPVYMQARSIDAEAKPKELSMAGAIPLPYNVRLLDGQPGQIYLCEGVIDTLTLLEQGFPAVGVPGAANFKPAWVPLFRSKAVHVVFDPDAPGESGAARAIDLLHGGGIEARRLQPPKGLDINDWFKSG